ncbi:MULTISPECIES: hypothetical protein [unclassified Pseudoalteromonas]|nr:MULTISPECIES: hypothetical protein [unclassified Pseudoalteromonas]
MRFVTKAKTQRIEDKYFKLLSELSPLIMPIPFCGWVTMDQ